MKGGLNHSLLPFCLTTTGLVYLIVVSRGRVIVYQQTNVKTTLHWLTAQGSLPIGYLSPRCSNSIWYRKTHPGPQRRQQLAGLVWHALSSRHLFAGSTIRTSLTPESYGPTLWRWLASYNSDTQGDAGGGARSGLNWDRTDI